MEMTLVDAGPEFTHIALSGRIDLQGVGDFDHEFTKQTVTRKKGVIVDMSGVDFLASIGMRTLITVAKALNRYSAKLVLLNPHPNVEEALTTAGFDQIMPIEHDFEKAVESVTNRG